MQIPKRRSQMLRKQDDQGEQSFITPEGLERLKHELIRLQKTDRPKTVEDLTVALAKGDLSENAEYHDAKGKLSRIDGRIFSIKERIKNANVIEHGAGPTGQVRIGSTVVLSVDNEKRTYRILGPQETDPSRGRISYISPLGAALMGHVAGDTVNIDTGMKSTDYRIEEVS